MKIRPVGAELFHGQTDRQTDMRQLTVAFRNIAKAPKNVINTKKSKNTRKFTYKDRNELEIL